METKLPKIVVIGGTYIDVALRCSQIPSVGQSSTGTALAYNVTGSGANSAVQAALCDCNVHLISKIGGDPFAKMLKQSLNEFGVNTDYVFTAEAKNSGAVITIVNSSGENTTLRYNGANSALSAADIESAEDIISDADVCLIHGQMPINSILSAIRLCKLHRTGVVIDPTKPTASVSGSNNSTMELPIEYFTGNIVIPNLYEAADITDYSSVNSRTAKLVGSDLVSRGVAAAVITMGKHGCMVISRDITEHVKAFEIELVDYTGTGDAFAGAFAACCAVDDDLLQSVKFASAAGALACTKFGTMEAMPKKTDIIELLQKEDIE